MTGGFRSRRTCLVYSSVLDPVGISFSVDPVFSASASPENWTESWHGIQEVGLQFVTLWYYRLVVLPAGEG